MMKNKRIIVSGFVAVLILACACPVSGLLPTSTDSTELPPTLSPALPTISPNNNLPKILSNPATQPSPKDIPPTATATNDSVSTEKIIYSDDFSVESEEMETYSDENGIVETRDGAYAVLSTSDVWNWGNSKSEFSNVVIEFDATLIQGPANNNAGIGIVCRLSGREDESIDGYLLAISSDGYYSISIAEAGTLNPLVNWTSSDAIHTGKVTNHIRATCNNSELSLEVNGQLLANATSANGNLASGTIAFAAISYEEAEPVAEVHFDNLTISEP